MTLRHIASLASILAAFVPLTCALAAAQQNPPTATVQTIATVPVEGVSLSGSLSVENGRATIGNNGAITAGDKTAHVSLTRGGNLNVCVFN